MTVYLIWKVCTVQLKNFGSLNGNIKELHGQIGEMYVRWSPHQFVQNFKTPMLVVHGANDFRVPESQAFELFTALQKMGVKSKFLYFPDETHFCYKTAKCKNYGGVRYLIGLNNLRGNNYEKPLTLKNETKKWKKKKNLNRIWK